jgi:hypothetical protein
MKTAIAIFCLLLYQGQFIVAKDIYVARREKAKNWGQAYIPSTPLKRPSIVHFLEEIFACTCLAS